MATPLLDIETEKIQDCEKDSYFLKMNIKRNQNIDSQIFVYKYNPQQVVATFDHVASSVDLSELSKHRPAPGNLFYLDNFINLEFKSIKTLEDTEAMILKDVNQLLQNWAIISVKFNKKYITTLVGE